MNRRKKQIQAMNKYQIAFDRVARYCSDARLGVFRYELTDELSTLYELAEKATPKKVFETDHSYICRNCANIFTMKYEGMCVPCLHGIKYCPSCGQAQDWGDVK